MLIFLDLRAGKDLAVAPGYGARANATLSRPPDARIREDRNDFEDLDPSAKCKSAPVGLAHYLQCGAPITECQQAAAPSPHSRQGPEANSKLLTDKVKRELAPGAPAKMQKFPIR
nr:MAG: hypothetical protein DIU57_14775 [Pseudomonadota bacterium]